MDKTDISKNSSYLPVAWEYRETAEEFIQKGQSGKIFFFNQEKQVDEAQGKIIKLEELISEGVFLVLDTDKRIRLDRVITLFGKIGAAYGEYDAYANACLDCMGGHDVQKESPTVDMPADSAGCVPDC